MGRGIIGKTYDEKKHGSRPPDPPLPPDTCPECLHIISNYVSHSSVCSKRPIPPEPDFKIIGTMYTSDEEQRRNQERMHDDWHRKNPDRQCEHGSWYHYPDFGTTSLPGTPDWLSFVFGAAVALLFVVLLFSIWQS